MKKDFIITVGISGLSPGEWEPMVREIGRYGITQAALFLINFGKPEREKIYRSLKTSPIKEIPLVHLRNDMTKEELEFLQRSYGTRYFTCHESDFIDNGIDRWNAFHKDIYLEMNADNIISPEVRVEDIGGFCVDTGHFKAAMESAPNDLDYQLERKNARFSCNHIAGWDNKKQAHTHHVTSYLQFDYLKTLPDFIFGKVMAIELTNSIKEQLEFKHYLENLFFEKNIES